MNDKMVCYVHRIHSCLAVLYVYLRVKFRKYIFASIWIGAPKVIYMELCNIECWRIYLGWKTENDLFNAVEHLPATKTRQGYNKNSTVRHLHSLSSPPPSTYFLLSLSSHFFFRRLFATLIETLVNQRGRNVKCVNAGRW